MNDECTKGGDKRDDNHSRGVHGALRVLVTPASSFALTRSDQIGRLLMMNTKEQYEKGGAWVLRESRGGSVGRGPGGVAVERGGGSRKPLVPRELKSIQSTFKHSSVTGTGGSCSQERTTGRSTRSGRCRGMQVRRRRDGRSRARRGRSESGTGRRRSRGSIRRLRGRRRRWG